MWLRDLPGQEGEHSLVFVLVENAEKLRTALFVSWTVVKFLPLPSGVWSAASFSEAKHALCQAV